MIDQAKLVKWTDQARRDDWHLTFVGSDIRQMLGDIIRLRAALAFYADPFEWKRRNDPGDDFRVPDFYSETSFGDTAKAALGPDALTQDN